MTLSGIPPHLLLAAAELPENRAAADALRHAAALSAPPPVSLPSQALDGVQGGVETSGKRRRAEGLDSLRLTLYGAPRTKKTSNQLQRFGGRLKVVPSAAWMKWRDACLKQISPFLRLRDQPYNLCALFYRDADRGDLVGYLQGLQDVLQEAQIISDDRWFKSLDGSRLRVDRERPRVELEILPTSGE